MSSIEIKNFANADEAGHDAWVVGDEEAIAFEFHGAWGE